jgi:hypothetical protein
VVQTHNNTEAGTTGVVMGWNQNIGIVMNWNIGVEASLEQWCYHGLEPEYWCCGLEHWC